MVLLIFVLLLSSLCFAAASSVAYETRWFNQTLDHFRFGSNPSKFSQRYLYNDDNWGNPQSGISGAPPNPPALPADCKGPILFYSGNEGAIDGFWESNGFMISELAPKWGGLLVFAELRYYGETLPFGSDSLTPENAVYLTTEQALADYALLITHLKASTPGMESCPVITFGTVVCYHPFSSFLQGGHTEELFPHICV
jgi:hypothetical protein